jgi:hypothetical protein
MANLHEEGRRVNPTLKPIELRDQLNLAKGKRLVNDRKEEDNKKIKCFKCQESGHHQKDCTNNLICYKCKEEGHMAIKCSVVHAKSGELKMYGFAILEPGFYSMKIAGEKDM